MNLFHLGIILIFFISSFSYAGEIQLGEPIYKGSACPEGSIRIFVDHHKKSLQFEIDPMKIEIGRLNKKLTDQIECSISVPVTVPRNLSFAVAPVTYNGTVILPSNAQSALKIVYYYDYSYGSASSSYGTKFTGDLNRTYSIVTKRSQSHSPFWSACGVSADLRIHISLQVATNSTQLPAEFTIENIESLDLMTQSCN